MEPRQILGHICTIVVVVVVVITTLRREILQAQVLAALSDLTFVASS